MPGLSIPSFKKHNRSERIGSMPLPSTVILYASQHIGAPSEIIVKKGDEVERGGMLARAKGHCSVNLHAPVRGKVLDVGSYNLPSGAVSDAVVLEKSGDEQDILLLPPLKEKTPESLRKRAFEAGIAGLGGAGFPAHVKMEPPLKIETAFMNGCECEPFLTADERLMIEEAEKVVSGLEYMRIAVGARESVIGIEEDKPEAISRISAAAAKIKNMRVEVLPKVYPQGYEKMLITAVTGKEVPSGGLPHDIGVSVHNTGTCFSLYEAVVESKPLIERIITVGGPKVFESKNIRVSIGTPISEILSYYHVSPAGIYNLVMGGPMMGASVDSIDAGILKTTSGLLLFEAEGSSEYPCLRCGKCLLKCPMRLNPQVLNKAYQAGLYEEMVSSDLKDCMECGCCSYICPSGIPLTSNFRAGKKKTLV